MDKTEIWRETRARIRALTEGEEDVVALMATVACELFHAFDGWDWVGFYRNVGRETLKIGPYQGGHGCLTIPFSRGVCGAAARTGRTQVVDDVDAFPGHIACSSSTRSEIVAPVFDGCGALLGVLDVDSDRPAFFDDQDRAEIEAMLAEVFGRLGAGSADGRAAG
ncbi:GAF domain-containing protein [Oceanicella actignis]|uniref:GAF domain-containing protein n=1 Tax=Oceanicella actignis TaxID=1189325 RepID=UPI0011E6FBBF|nr:GAF domain-containing protein [Oceanicella actignis]TYO90129.1 GAF domain-containing protein [Oceanicella actignis]